MNPTLPPPADFAAMAHLGLAPMRDHYRVGDKTLKRWERETGIAIRLGKDGPKPHVMPADFAAVQQDMTVRQMMAHYRVGRQIIRNWLAAVGEKRTRFAAKVAKEKARAASVTRLNASSLHPVDRPHRDGSRAGMAADFLRRFGAVYRCTPTGRADLRGSHWRRGSAVLTAAELIERAERNGWEPDAWRMVA